MTNRVLIIAPRGFAKSTLCSVFFPLWLALFGKKRDIIIVSSTISLAMEHLRKIRLECETNTRILNDFGDVKSDKWTEDMLVFKNGTIIRAKGRGFQIRGFRPDIILCDDLEDDEVVSSKDQREKLQDWFFRTLLPSLKPNQPLVYIGTKLHQFSLISMLEKREEFAAKTYRALDEDGKSIWEDYFPTELLLKMKRDIGTYAWQSEFMNNPISGKEQPIKPEYLKGVVVEGKASYACLAIDPAISERESADYRAFSLFERTEHGFREVFSEHGRWGIEEQVQRIIDIYQRYRKNYQYLRVLIEEVAFQKVFSHILTETSRKQGIFIPVSRAELGVGPNKRPRDKMTRLLAVSHLFEQRIVQIKNPELMEELLEFPHGDYDDLLDSTVFSLYWLMNFRQGAAIFKPSPEKLVDAKKSYYVKEVRPGVYVGAFDDAGIPLKPKGIINYDHI